MIRILLIRHGSTDLLGRVLYGRTAGIHLNSEGVRQAELLAEALKRQYEIDAVISSPLERALETAKPIAEQQGRAVRVEKGIIEVDFGAWVGKSFHELHEIDAWRAFNRQRSTSCPPGGESMMEIQARAWRTVETVAADYDAGSTIAIITHGDVIRCLLVLLLGVSIDHIHRLEIAPCSVSEVSVGEHDPLIRHVNQIYC